MENEYCYSDMNGNLFIITSNHIEYIPVTEKNSSSGTYSGGIVVKKNISKEQYKNIISEIEVVFNNKALQIETKLRPSASLYIKRKSGIEKSIIILISDEQKKLEDMLNQLIT